MVVAVTNEAYGDTVVKIFTDEVVCATVSKVEDTDEDTDATLVVGKVFDDCEDVKFANVINEDVVKDVASEVVVSDMVVLGVVPNDVIAVVKESKDNVGIGLVVAADDDIDETVIVDVRTDDFGDNNKVSKEANDAFDSTVETSVIVDNTVVLKVLTDDVMNGTVLVLPNIVVADCLIGVSVIDGVAYNTIDEAVTNDAVEGPAVVEVTDDMLNGIISVDITDNVTDGCIGIDDDIMEGVIAAVINDVLVNGSIGVEVTDDNDDTNGNVDDKINDIC